MSKGFKKMLMLGISIGACAGALYYYNQKKIEKELEDFDDFEDEDFFFEDEEDDDEANPQERSYVSLNPTAAAQTVKNVLEDAGDAIVSPATETIEEFFNEDSEES